MNTKDTLACLEKRMNDIATERNLNVYDNPDEVRRLSKIERKLRRRIAELNRLLR